MTPTDSTDPARAALLDAGQRLAGLCRSLPNSAVAIPNSTWTVREAVVHTASLAELYAEIALGTPGPLADLSVATVARRNAERIADNPESDPGKLADLLEQSVARLASVAGAAPSGKRVQYLEFSPLEVTPGDLVGMILGEVVVHGYDIACAVGAPWPISPDEALLILGSYAPLFGLAPHPENTPGHTGGYGIELRGGPRFTMRFVDGTFSLEPPDVAPVDCVISAHPVAFLLVATGRLTQWEAIALGLLSAGGERPTLALGFTSLFVFP
jgi:uncharacterized protein (TIGR03083 family)